MKCLTPILNTGRNYRALRQVLIKPHKQFISINCKRPVVFVPVILLVIVAVSVGLYFAFDSGNSSAQFRGAVVSNGLECAEIGKAAMVQGGTVADAAIATLFCEGVTNPQSMGLGGGFFATIFIKSTGKTETLVAREVAPLAATEDMFVNKTVSGGLAVAVPGEIKGYVELHRKYGKLDWASLVEPTIKLCEEGITVSPYLATKLKEKEDVILNNPSMREIFVNPTTGKLYEEGYKAKRLKLAETLKTIAKEGEKAIYGGGEIGKKLVEDIQNFGGIVTEEDLRQYKVRWAPPATTKMDRFTVHSIGLPGTGPVLNLILNMIHKHINVTFDVLWQRIVECFKHAYGQRTHLGDIEFLPEIEGLVANMSTQSFADELFAKVLDNYTYNDYQHYGANTSAPTDQGTANIAVLLPNGDAIVVTSTINNVFGNKLRSQQTGIILNDEMDDFSVPGKQNSYGLYPSPANFIKPKKMPLSSMVPTIILDENNNPRLLIGGSGGSKITTSVVQTIIRHLFLSESINDSIQSLRLHHQLSPMVVQYERGFNTSILNQLIQRNHQLSEIRPENGFSALTAISVLSPVRTEAVYDNRRVGSFAYL